MLRTTSALLFVFAINAHASVNCVPGQVFQTTIGAVFKCITTSNGDGAWQAPDGKAWSINLGRFQNEGLDKNLVVVDSEAVRECKKIGADLPTADDYFQLRNYFERDSVNAMTPKGIADMQWLFRDMGDKSNANRAVFWTSTVAEHYPHLAGTFNGNWGSGASWNRIYGLSVRCVFVK